MAPKRYLVVLTDAAKKGLLGLSGAEQTLVVKQLDKLERAPELGQPLGNKMGTALAGYRKLYVARKRIRVIYSFDGQVLTVTVVAVGAREDAVVYGIAAGEAKRLRRIR